VYSYDNMMSLRAKRGNLQITDVNYPAGFNYPSAGSGQVLATDTTFNEACPERSERDAAGNRSSVIKPALSEAEWGSGTCSYTSNNLNQYTAADGTSFQYDSSGNMTHDGHYTYSYDPENRLTKVTKDSPGQGVALDSFAAYTTGGDANWVADSDFAHSGDIGDSQESWMYIDVSGPGMVRFSWKVSSELNYDLLQFSTDGQVLSSISGTQNWNQVSFSVTGTGTHRLRWRYVKDSSVSSGSDCGWVKAVVWEPTPPPGMALGKAVDSLLTYTTGGSANWRVDGSGHSGGSAQSGNISDSQQSWLQTTVEGAGTVTFWWKASSEGDCDCLQLWVDGVLRDSISGEEDWAQKTYTITTAGTHTIQWRYQKDGSIDEGDDCGWVDEVQWSGPIAEDPPANDWGWTPYVYNAGLTYTYDPSGRRIEKKYDGITVLKYVYDGDSCIAEYDASGNLRRKYIYGPGIDQPVCMIEATQSYAGTYYYHFDALGSVVALTNSSGNTVEVYDYSVYGQVGASDASHPNRFMFTGREFDKETGLYYYRARYYKPEIGRFLQADQVGYEGGMNLYRYCHNNPWNRLDPFGHDPWGIKGVRYFFQTLFPFTASWWRIQWGLCRGRNG
jgi:RHS repeat-associated protein